MSNGTFSKYYLQRVGFVGQTPIRLKYGENIVERVRNPAVPNSIGILSVYCRRSNHAIIRVTQEFITVSDTGTFNGTYVNGAVYHDPNIMVTLHIGDILGFGCYTEERSKKGVHMYKLCLFTTDEERIHSEQLMNVDMDGDDNSRIESDCEENDDGSSSGSSSSSSSSIAIQGESKNSNVPTISAVAVKSPSPLATSSIPRPMKSPIDKMTNKRKNFLINNRLNSTKHFNTNKPLKVSNEVIMIDDNSSNDETIDTSVVVKGSVITDNNNNINKKQVQMNNPDKHRSCGNNSLTVTSRHRSHLNNGKKSFGYIDKRTIKHNTRNILSQKSKRLASTSTLNNSRLSSPASKSSTINSSPKVTNEIVLISSDDEQSNNAVGKQTEHKIKNEFNNDKNKEDDDDDDDGLIDNKIGDPNKNEDQNVIAEENRQNKENDNDKHTNKNKNNDNVKDENQNDQNDQDYQDDQDNDDDDDDQRITMSQSLIDGFKQEIDDFYDIQNEEDDELNSMVDHDDDDDDDDQQLTSNTVLKTEVIEEETPNNNNNNNNNNGKDEMNQLESEQFLKWLSKLQKIIPGPHDDCDSSDRDSSGRLTERPSSSSSSSLTVTDEATVTTIVDSATKTVDNNLNACELTVNESTNTEMDIETTNEPTTPTTTTTTPKSLSTSTDTLINTIPTTLSSSSAAASASLSKEPTIPQKKTGQSRKIEIIDVQPMTIKKRRYSTAQSEAAVELACIEYRNLSSRATTSAEPSKSSSTTKTTPTTIINNSTTDRNGRLPKDNNNNNNNTNDNHLSKSQIFAIKKAEIIKERMKFSIKTAEKINELKRKFISKPSKFPLQMRTERIHKMDIKTQRAIKLKELATKISEDDGNEIKKTITKPKVKMTHQNRGEFLTNVDLYNIKPAARCTNRRLSCLFTPDPIHENTMTTSSSGSSNTTTTTPNTTTPKSFINELSQNKTGTTKTVDDISKELDKLIILPLPPAVAAVHSLLMSRSTYPSTTGSTSTSTSAAAAAASSSRTPAITTSILKKSISQSKKHTRKIHFCETNDVRIIELYPSEIAEMCNNQKKEEEEEHEEREEEPNNINDGDDEMNDGGEGGNDAAGDDGHSGDCNENRTVVSGTWPNKEENYGKKIPIITAVSNATPIMIKKPSTIPIHRIECDTRNELITWLLNCKPIWTYATSNENNHKMLNIMMGKNSTIDTLDGYQKSMISLIKRELWSTVCIEMGRLRQLPFDEIKITNTRYQLGTSHMRCILTCSVNYKDKNYMRLLVGQIVVMLSPNNSKEEFFGYICSHQLDNYQLIMEIEIYALPFDINLLHSNDGPNSIIKLKLVTHIYKELQMVNALYKLEHSRLRDNILNPLSNELIIGEPPKKHYYYLINEIQEKILHNAFISCTTNLPLTSTSSTSSVVPVPVPATAAASSASTSIEPKTTIATAITSDPSPLSPPAPPRENKIVKPNITIIDGPPGTGKTLIAVNLLLQLKYDSRSKGRKILVCSGTNKAVDNITWKLLSARTHIGDVNEHFKLVRHGNKHKMMNDILCVAAQNLLKQSKSTNGNGTTDTDNNCKPAIGFNELIQDADIVCTTVNSGFFLISTGVKFDICLIDEASLCTENYTLLPVLFNVSTLILVGDNRTVPITHISKPDKNSLLRKSIFSRIINAFRTKQNTNLTEHKLWPIQTLTIQYRMHPEILLWPNEYFYGNQIVTDEKIINNHYDMKPYTILNMNNEGINDQFDDRIEFICNLIKGIKCLVDLRRNSMALVTVMNLEQHTLMQKCRIKRQPLFEIHSLETFESFSLFEKDIVIFVCLNDKSVQYFNRFNLINIAMTRARKSFLFCGYFNEAQLGGILKTIVDNAKQRNCYFQLENNNIQSAINLFT